MFTFEEICELATPIARKHGIKSLSLFGSYARGDATESSDVDFLFDDGGAISSLWEYAGLVLDLEKVFGVHVDLVSTDAENKDFLTAVGRESRLVYER